LDNDDTGPKEIAGPKESVKPNDQHFAWRI